MMKPVNIKQPIEKLTLIIQFILKPRAGNSGREEMDWWLLKGG